MVLVKVKFILFGCRFVVKVVNLDLYNGVSYGLLLDMNFKKGGCNNIG